MRARTKYEYHQLLLVWAGKCNYWENVLVEIQGLCNCPLNAVCGVMCKAAEGASKQQVVASIVIKGTSNVRVEQGLHFEFTCRMEEQRHPFCNLNHLYMFKIKINNVNR